MPAAVPDEAILQFPPPSASFPLSFPLDRRSVVRPLEQGGKRVQIGIVWVDAMRCRRDSIRAEESVQAQAARLAAPAYTRSLARTDFPLPLLFYASCHHDHSR